MSAELIGALAGAGLGLVGYVALSGLAKRIEGNQGDATAMRNATLLRTVAKLDVFLFAAVGYFVGPMLLT